MGPRFEGRHYRPRPHLAGQEGPAVAEEGAGPNRAHRRERGHGQAPGRPGEWRPPQEQVGHQVGDGEGSEGLQE
eukprot:327113-Heterocapsa_arctica.AAC.1